MNLLRRLRVPAFLRATVMASFGLASLVSGAGAQTLVDISNVPLFGGRSPHPNVVVTTSVEFPTVGSAYLNDQNGVPVPYLQANTYVGYFDGSKCYTYNGTSTNGYFAVSGPVDGNHECASGSAFSGNFMNWATMSAIDEFRYAMTGGNRVDENGANNGTVLERAVLPDGSINGVPDFYALPSNFPRHTLSGGTIDGVASSNVSAILPFSNGTLYVTNCKNTVFFGTGGGGSCNAPDANVGTYQVRVLVCDNTEGPARSDLCLQYGTGGKYKPVGQVEVNANRMRFAVFGYLMDHDYPGYSAPCNNSGWSRCRYGGVLRAPMTYVGPTTYDANQNPSANTHTEVNTDGTLAADPEGTAASVGGTYSGFINYINKFGSSGTYKRFDPAGEMFYEAIRYYQNLGPTDLAAAGITVPMTDGFPVTTTWVDPIQSTCSANYIINLSDANTWDDTYLPGFNNNITPGPGRPSSRAPEGGLDASLWASRIGDLESTTTSITTNDVRPELAGLQNQLTGTTGTSSQLVSGAAYWANVNDVRPDLVGVQTIKTISFDVAEGSTDIHDRSLYLMGKYGGFSNTIDRSTDTFANPFWSSDPANPTGPAIRSNLEWEDSVGSAYPTNYLLASDPQKLINGLRAAFARINAQTGTLSGASLTSANLTNGPAGAYIATFNPLKWSGSVLFNSVSVDPMTGLLVVSTSPIWNSATLLDARCGTVVSGSTVCTDASTAAGKRNIVTTLRVSGVRVAANFTDAAISADTSYLTALNTNPATNAPDGLAQQRINYLRGYRADEASALGFRSRDSAMGDIINSGPVYIGSPSATIPDADYQSGFFATYVNRTQAVYVGANDGMLHAIDAPSGVELFAYVPGFSYANLNDLTSPGYQHDTFVDTVPKVQEVKLNGNWKTVLVGANGNGAQGIFGLDVTDPSSFGPTKVLFEFSDADDADFGNVLAAPEIAKLQVGVASGVPVYRYFAVVTGYNNRRTSVNGHVGGDTSVSTDTTNRGVLFLIALDHVLNTAWVQGTDYYKFYFPASDTTIANGLGPVTILQSRSGDQSTAAMYFGDLQGNLWRFNTVGADPTTWVPALGTVTTPLPIFVATDASSNRQPITARVELAGGPFGGTLVVFGTGRYLGISDATLPGAQQSEYSILDTASATVISRASDLVSRTATVSSGTVSVTGSAFNYSGTSGKKGWYLDFPNSTSVGERSVTKPAIRTNLLTFTTLTLATDICGGGSGYIYQLNALTGLPFLDSSNNTLLPGGYVSTVGIPGPPRIVDLTFSAGVQHPAGVDINTQRQTTLVAGTLGKIDSTRDASGNATAIQTKTPPSGRISWREISNWNDLTGH